MLTPFNNINFISLLKHLYVSHSPIFTNISNFHSNVRSQSPIRFAASSNRASSCTNAIRTKPSPSAPKASPGITTTPSEITFPGKFVEMSILLELEPK